MIKNCIIDTGPLVALLNKRDSYHDRVTEILKTIEPPLLTCESVISEACFLLRNVHNGQNAVLELLSRNLVSILFTLEDEIIKVKSLLSKYADIPISFADACLICMSDTYPLSAVFTMDSDFTIYRRSNRHVIPTIMP